MAKIIVFALQKGGVYKTGLTMNMGGMLARDGKRVLLIDGDPQASLSANLDMAQPDNAMDDVILHGAALVDIIKPVVLGEKPVDNLWLAPSHINLSATDTNMTGYRREYRLTDALASATLPEYDYILIDSPPSLGIMFVNCMVAAQEIVIPMSCEYQALLSIPLFYETFLDMQKLNPGLTIAGLVRTKVKRTTHAKDVCAALEKQYGSTVRIYQTMLYDRVDVMNAAAAHEFIYRYAPEESAALECEALYKEIFP